MALITALTRNYKTIKINVSDFRFQILDFKWQAFENKHTQKNLKPAKCERTLNISS